MALEMKQAFYCAHREKKKTAKNNNFLAKENYLIFPLVFHLQNENARNRK